MTDDRLAELKHELAVLKHEMQLRESDRIAYAARMAIEDCIEARQWRAYQVNLTAETDRALVAAGTQLDAESRAALDATIRDCATAATIRDAARSENDLVHAIDTLTKLLSN
jgi:hypothetical protein